MNEVFWISRLKRDFESCQNILAALGPGSISESEKRVMEASLARGLGHLSEAERLIEGLEETGLAAFERASNAHQRGEYAQALEYFLKAKHKLKNPAFKQMALLNATLCMENLGYPYEKSKKEIQEFCARKGLQIGKLERLVRSISSEQILALEEREVFRSGFPSKNRSSRALSQASYFQIWRRALEKDIHIDGNSQKWMEELVLKGKELPASGFRLRTLRFLQHPGDLESFDVSDWADRLYLWVWYWLRKPSNSGLHRILRHLGSKPLYQLIPKMTAEDRLMTRNSLLWLGLFDRKLKFSGWNLDGPSWEHFEFEKNLIFLLKARRESDPSQEADMRAELECHPLAERPDYFLAQFFWQPDLLPGLKGLLQKEKSSHLLKIDLTTHQIESPKGRLVSPPMAVAIDILVRNNSLSFPELLEGAFGIPGYDPSTHQAKIYNLLSRIKEVLPPATRIFTKNHWVYFEGEKENILLVRPSQPEEILQQDGLWNLIRSQTTKRDSREGDEASTLLSILRKHVQVKIISRRDLESSTGYPRSTTNRLITKMVAQGYLKPEGVARSRKYRVLI